MSGGREATSEQSSSIREGGGYDNPSGCELEEDLTWSLAREPLAHSPVEGEEGYEEDEGKGGDEGEEGDKEEEGGHDEEEDESDEGSEEDNDGLVGRVDSSSTRPFILLSI